MDSTRAISELHDSVRALGDALGPVARAAGPFDVLAAANAGDQALALALARTRSCVSSMYEVAAHVLALHHLWDERHLPALAAERPIVSATSLTIVSPRDAWWRAVEAVAFGSAHGNGAVAGLRALRHPLAEPVAALVAVAEEVGAALSEVEPHLASGVTPDMAERRIVLDPPEPAPEPVPDAAPGTERRRPRWGSAR